MKQKDFLTVLIPAFILTILWVIFNIYHSLVTSTIKDPLSFQIIPIEGDFDTNAINEIKNKKRVDPIYEIQSKPEETPTGVPEIVEEESEEVATESAEEET